VLSTFPLVPKTQRDEALNVFRRGGNATTKPRRHEE